MKKIPAVLIFTLAAILVVCGVAVAEYNLRTAIEIPEQIFIGIPLLGVGAAIISASRVISLGKASAVSGRRVILHLAAALLLTLLSMLLLADRYRGDYDPLQGRVAPDGSPANSISWDRQGGRYVELLNGRFRTEITEAQYHQIMGKQQQALAIVVVAFSSLGFWASAALLVLERRGTTNGS